MAWPLGEACYLGYDRLLVLLLLLGRLLTKGAGHVGHPCGLFPICLASNSYCDTARICRCKADYPVNVTPHSCRKAQHYGDRCSYSEECSYLDPKSYCTQIPYQSICECYSGFIYDKTKKACIEPEAEGKSRSSTILPTAVGVSLALTCGLCCCFALWHICRRRIDAFKRIGVRRQGSLSARTTEANEVALPIAPPLPLEDETLPSYSVALSLQEPSSLNNTDDPPPTYDEVISASTGSKQ